MLLIQYKTIRKPRALDWTASLAPIYIGKESDRHWEEGEDLSLLDFKAIEYKRKGYMVATDEQLAQIAKVPRENEKKGSVAESVRFCARLRNA